MTRGRERRGRRGSVTVLTGGFMVGFALFGAAIVDATRVLAVRSEMQTAADAAALSGAIQMLSDSSVAVDTARAYAGRNGVRLSGTEVDSLSVVTGVWSPAAGAFMTGTPEDAIHVEYGRQVNFVLAQLLGVEGIRLRVTATAWSSAPVNGSRGCIKPLVLPYDYVRRLVNPPSAMLTPDDMRRLRELTEAERTDTFYFGPRETSVDRSYFPVELPAIDYETGEPLETSQGTYLDYLRECKTTQVSAGDWVLVAPTGDRRSHTVQGIRDLCEGLVEDGGMGGVFTEGVCYVSGVATGIPLKVAFWDSPPDYGTYSGGAVQVKTLGSFVVTHVDVTNAPDTELPRATLRGHLQTSRDFGRVGSEASTLRRAVIVE